MVGSPQAWKKNYEQKPVNWQKNFKLHLFPYKEWRRVSPHLLRPGGSWLQLQCHTGSSCSLTSWYIPCLPILDPNYRNTQSVSMTAAHNLSDEQQIIIILTCSSPASNPVHLNYHSPQPIHHGPVLCCCSLAHHTLLETHKMQIPQMK